MALLERLGMHFSEASQFWSNHGQMPTWQSHNSPKKIVLMILVMELHSLYLFGLLFILRICRT
jgi:hypothetical protein